MYRCGLGIRHCCSTGKVFDCGRVFQDKTKKHRSRRPHRGRWVANLAQHAVDHLHITKTLTAKTGPDTIGCYPFANRGYGDFF